MGLLEKITANMELTQLKKFKLQKAILALMLEWKHLEEYMDSTQHSFQECLDELQLKENYLNSVLESAVESNKEMEYIRVSIEGKRKELDDKAREFQVFREEQINALDLKEKQFGLIGKSIEERMKLVELREEKLAAKQKVVEGNFKKFKVEEKQFEDIRKSVRQRIEEINSKEMQMEKRCKELESKAKELDDRAREIESMAKPMSNVDHTRVETEIQLEDTPANSSIDIQFFIRMDGKGLQSFLNQREKDHDSMADEVYQALQLSSDPAKLVLDAMEGFYPTHPNEGNGEFKVDIIRRSCLLLLEQLLRISPQLQPRVKMEAMELLLQWKAKLSALPDSVEVLGILFLLASYNLPVPFNAYELFDLVEIVAEHRQTSELCRVLGLTDSLTGIKNIELVRKKTAVYSNDASAHQTENSKQKAAELPKVAFSKQGHQAPQKSKAPVTTKAVVVKVTPSNPAANQTGKKRQAPDSSLNSNRSVRFRGEGGEKESDQPRESAPCPNSRVLSGLLKRRANEAARDKQVVTMVAKLSKLEEEKKNLISQLYFAQGTEKSLNDKISALLKQIEEEKAKHAAKEQKLIDKFFPK